MNKTFYPKLALTNIRKHGKLYFPYLLTCTFTIAFFYIMDFLTHNSGIKTMPGSDSLKFLMFIGTRVIAIFSAIFLFYTNSFLMKQRKKEMGLYNILGMEKRHIGRIMVFETLYTALSTLITGLVSGILISKLSLMLLCKLLSFPNPMGLSISTVSIKNTCILFACIFGVTLLSNLISVVRSKPVELLGADHSGEKEPKTKWLIAIIGVVTIGIGYGFALTTKNAITAVTYFFGAVLLVIIGTYCLFTAGSIVFLKLLKKNKNYYYQTKHFTSVSGMLYRMKQNAVGLSNICILCTMVLIIISTTVCLYIGSEDSLNTRYPYDLSLNQDVPYGSNDKDTVLNKTNEIIKNNNLKTTTLKDYECMDLSLTLDNSKFIYSDLNKNFDISSLSNLYYVYIIPYEDYSKMGGEDVKLNDDEVLIYSKDNDFTKNITLCDTKYRMNKQLKSIPFKTDSEGIGVKLAYVFINRSSFNSLIESLPQKYEGFDTTLTYNIYANLSGTSKQKINCCNAIDSVYSNTWCRDQMKKEFYTVYGGFLFLGIFLGILFSMATVLIIYYKQISEGYDDRQRFIIMQKVGMSKKEVKQSIHSQVLTVFLLPIIVAGIHIAAAFNIIKQLLAMFGLTNSTLFIECTIITIIAFLAIYMIVFRLTSKVYYKIVQG